MKQLTLSQLTRLAAYRKLRHNVAEAMPIAVAASFIVVFFVTL